MSHLEIHQSIDLRMVQGAEVFTEGKTTEEDKAGNDSADQAAGEAKYYGDSNYCRDLMRHVFSVIFKYLMFDGFP